MKCVTISAPGKLMLFGEHAVVYNHPCLVTAVNERMHTTVEVTQENRFELQAPDVQVTDYKKLLGELGKDEIPKGAKFVEIAVKNVYEKYSLKSGICVTTRSDFSSEFGFGSSSAVTVCIVKALSELFGLNLTNKEVFDLSYKTVLDIQKKGSGFDVAAAVYGGTLYFITGGKTIEPLSLGSLPLIVGYSGVKADTVTLISKVKKFAEEEPETVDKIYNKIEKIVEAAKSEIEAKNWQKVGELMQQNQTLLSGLGVSIPKLDDMIQAVLGAGAYGAKLSGAGGGDCIIALAPKEKKEAVELAITQAGGTILKVSTNAEGVKTE